MDEKEAEARPVMGTIFLVIFTRSRNAATGDNSMYCMIPDPFPSSAFGKGSAPPDYYIESFLLEHDECWDYQVSQLTWDYAS